MNKRLFVILGLALLLAGLVFWCSTMKRQEGSVVTSVAQQDQQEEMKTFEPVKGAEGYVWFPVPELGIEIKVNKDIANELLYKVIEWPSEKNVLSAEFATKKLIEMGEKNGIAAQNESGRYNCTLGVFTRYNMSEKEYIAMQEEIYGKGNVSPVDVGGYFVQYATPQSGCSSGPDGYVKPDVDYEQFVVSNWLKRENNIKEFLQNSVRKIQ